MVMEKISVLEAKKLADKKGLKPGRVKSTNGLQFTNGKNMRLEVIDWETFETTLKKKRLAVYASGGWLKIMKEY